jgi:hypothetical protein
MPMAFRGCQDEVSGQRAGHPPPEAPVLTGHDDTPPRTVTFWALGTDRGNGSLRRRHPADTTGTGHYFHLIDDPGRQAL